MGTYLNPDIMLEVYHSGAWQDFTDKAISFEINGAGLLKPAVATIDVKNIGNIFTAGSLNFVNGSDARIRVNVRDQVEQIFGGKLYRKEGNVKPTKDVKYITLTGKASIHRLNHDTVTRTPAYSNYFTDTFIKDAIIDALANPDSGINSGFTLNTDGGIITTTRCPNDPKEQPLLDFIRDCLEEINYDGWCAHDSKNIYIYPVGSQTTNPLLTLVHPFANVKTVTHIENIANHILVWGDRDRGIPIDGDMWTEHSIDKYACWTAVDPTRTVVADSQTQVMYGEWNISLRPFDTTKGWIEAVCDLRVGKYSLIDARTRFDYLKSSVYRDMARNNIGYWILEDKNADKIAWKIPYGPLDQDGRSDLEMGIGDGTEINPTETADKWYYYGGSTVFDWSDIRKFYLRWTVSATGAPMWFVYLDGLRFSGQFPIDPLLYPILNPPAKDTNAVLYPVIYHHHTNVTSFEDAQIEGQRILALLKEKFTKYTISLKYCRPWIKFSQTGKLTLPEYNISNEDWIIANIRHAWKSKGNRLRTLIDVIPKVI